MVTIETEPFRPPTAEEDAVVRFLLANAGPDKDQLLVQWSKAEVAGNCRCGCGSLTIQISDAVDAIPRWVQVIAWDHPAAIEALVMTSDGRLSMLEITYFSSDSLGLPTVDQLVFERVTVR